MRTAQAADIAGIKVILVHAISESARRFYEADGYFASPIDLMVAMLPISAAIRPGG